jgi:hypothetical protein
VTGIFNARALIALVLAGVAGTVLNAAAIALFIALDLWTLALVPGRYAVAIALCLALPLLASQVSRLWFAIIGAVWLTVAASVLAKLVFGAGAPWLTVLALNLVYAVGALVVYALIARSWGKET